MTVCIAAMCDNGKRVVSASDGGITVGPVSGDLGMYKTKWMIQDGRHWQFLYSGEPGQADLIIDEFVAVAGSRTLSRGSRRTIKNALAVAYRNRYREWVSERILFSWGVDFNEFHRNGRRLFGDKQFEQLLSEIDYVAREEFKEQLLLIGWGATEHSAIILEVGRLGIRSHTFTGWGVIGSGSEVAMWSLLLHGQHRTWSLEDTLYTVAAAKVNAERSQGVAPSLSMSVSWQPPSKDSKALAHHVLADNEIKILRTLWENYGKPQVPAAVADDLRETVRKCGSSISNRSHIRRINQVSQGKRR